MGDKTKRTSGTGGGSNESFAVKELLMVIDDFKEKIAENEKKSKKENELIEKAQMDLKEMQDQAPFFHSEKAGLIKSLDEEYINKLSIYYYLQP